MKMGFTAAFFLLCTLICFVPQVSAQLTALETENLRLVYFDPVHTYLVPHAVRCFEKAYSFHGRLWEYDSDEKITVFMHDFTDYGNAGAKNVPENLVMIDIAPFSYAFETVPVNERINTVMNHELTHIVAMDKATGRDNFFRSIFWGKISPRAYHPETIIYDYLATPRRSAPRWYHEGIAVFLETWMAGGFGRALGAYDEMVFRTMVRDSARFYDPVGLEAEGTSVDFHVGVNSYLYGTRFFAYLAYHYGPDMLMDWVKRTGGSDSYFISQFKSVYNASLDDEWNRWIDWEKNFQQENLDSIKLYTITDYRSMSDNALGSVSRAFYDSTRGKVYAAISAPGTFAHVAALDVNDGSIDKICHIKGPALFFVSSSAYDPLSGLFFYTSDNYSWRDLMVVDVETKKKRMLQKDVRLGDIAFNPADSSIWGVRHVNGISTITRIPYPWTEWNKIHSLPFGYDMYDLDISPDGNTLSGALVKINGWQSLVTMNIDSLMAGDSTYTEHFDFGNSNPAGFVFSPDGKYLYGSSYYTGVSNIFRYDIANDSMDAVSNCETGLFRPIPIDGDSLIAFRYTGRGFAPVKLKPMPLEDVSATRYLGTMIVESHPIVRDWMLSPEDLPDVDSMIVSRGDYNPLAHVGLVSAYPVVEGYQHYTAPGIHMDLGGPLMIHDLGLTVSYTPSKGIPDDQRWHVKAKYSHMNWGMNFKYNAADFYDLFGPTKTSRKGYSLGINYERSLIFDSPRNMDFNFSLTGYGGLEKLPDYQNVSASYDKFLSSQMALRYSNLQASLGAVDYEKGIEWSLAASGNYVNDRIYPLIHTELDFGVSLFAHSAIWLRNSIGYSPGEHMEPFANFFFGGFGNNWVDYRWEKRYRQFYSFPGVELNSIGGTNYGKATLEWALPPLRFRRLGRPSLYCTWARLALFSTGIVTNVDNDYCRREVGSLGGQLDLRFQMLSHLRLTFSIGYAASFEEGRKPEDELMISVKLL